MIFAVAVWLAFGLFCLILGLVLGGAAGTLRTGVFAGLITWGIFTLFGLIAVGLSYLYAATEGAS
jgi:hypothetical protein